MKHLVGFTVEIDIDPYEQQEVAHDILEIFRDGLIWDLPNYLHTDRATATCSVTPLGDKDHDRNK